MLFHLFRIIPSEVQQIDTPTPVLLYALLLPVKLGNTGFQIYKLDTSGFKLSNNPK